jgi:hypothetical protein
MPSADFCLPHPGCYHPGRYRVSHESLSVSWLPSGLLSIDRQWLGQVLGHPGEPLPDFTHESPAAW